MSKRDYYEVLGVPKNVDDQGLKSAYRKLALKYHPDRNPGDKSAEEHFKEAAEAYSVLADAEKKARYDQFGHAGVGNTGSAQGFDPTVFSDFNDIFGGLGDIFGFSSSGHRKSGPSRGADLRYDLEISLEEAATGTEASLQIPREETCESCGGSGAAPGSPPETCQHCRGHGQVRYQQGFFTVARTCERCGGNGQTITNPCESCRGHGRLNQERKLTVKIPAGIDTGQQLRLQGEGGHGPKGGPAGDLYVVLHVKNHPVFSRNESDILCVIPVTFPTLVLGGTITVPTLGDEETLHISKSTSSGTRFRLRGKGLPHVNGRGRGDLFVDVTVDVPESVSSEQKQLIEELDKTMPQRTFEPDIRETRQSSDARPFFERVKDIFG